MYPATTNLVSDKMNYAVNFVAIQDSRMHTAAVELEIPGKARRPIILSTRCIYFLYSPFQSANAYFNVQQKTVVVVSLN